MLTTSLRHRRQRGQPCEIVVELFALFLCVFEDCSDGADNGKDEAAKGNRAQVKDLDSMEHLPSWPCLKSIELSVMVHVKMGEKLTNRSIPHGRAKSAAGHVGLVVGPVPLKCIVR